MITVMRHTQYVYDSYGRLTNVKHGHLAGGVFVEDTVQAVSYARDTYGRVTSVGWRGEETNYTYDRLNRLAEAHTTGNGWGDEYSYDGFGNMLGMTETKQSGLRTSTLVDPATNRLCGVTDACPHQSGA